MKYEGDVNYASNPYGTAPNRGGRRGLLGLGMAVVGIVAFAGAILVVYGKGDHASPDGGPPLLTADATPMKSRPEQPGGMEVPHQDKLVYERLNERGAKPNIERLLPPPEEPLPRPVVTPQMPPPPAMPEVPAVGQLPAPPPGATTTVPRLPSDGEAPVPGAAAADGQPVPPAVVAAAPAPAVAKTAPPPAAKPAPAAQPAPPKPAPAAPVQTATLAAPPKPAAPPAQAPAPQAAKPAAAPASPPAPAKAASGGGWRIQLAAVRSESEAASEWKRLSGRYPGALSGLSMQVVKADLGEKGIFYRVQGVGLDEGKAKEACAQLKAQSVGCVVVRP